MIPYTTSACSGRESVEPSAMQPNPSPIAARSADGVPDYSAVYVGLTDGVSLLLALWLCFASLTPRAPARSAGGSETIEIASAIRPSEGRAPGSSRADSIHPTHVLEGALRSTGAPSSDGSVVIDVSPDVFRALQEASSVRVICFKK